MQTFILSKDHKIEVEKVQKGCYKGYEVKLFEYYPVCGWRFLGSDGLLHDKDTLEYVYGIKLFK